MRRDPLIDPLFDRCFHRWRRRNIGRSILFAFGAVCFCTACVYWSVVTARSLGSPLPVWRQLLLPGVWLFSFFGTLGCATCSYFRWHQASFLKRSIREAFDRELTIEFARPDGQALGTVETVAKAVCEVLPGAEFFWCDSGPQRLAAAEGRHEVIPKDLRPLLEDLPTTAKGNCRRDDGLRLEFFPATDLSFLHVTVHGSRAAAEQLLAPLAAGRGWTMETFGANARALHDKPQSRHGFFIVIIPLMFCGLGFLWLMLGRALGLASHPLPDIAGFLFFFAIVGLVSSSRWRAERARFERRRHTVARA